MISAFVRRLPVLALLTLLLGGCGRDDSWHLKNVSGLLPDLQFDLQNGGGEPVTAQRYRDHTVLLYFGYTHCPDVCPTTLGELRAALDALGGRKNDVRVLFVSVDPARDTPAVLRQYVQYFGPQFVGLRGDQDQLQALARRYRVAYEPDPPDRNGSYAVAHSSGVFIFDRRGEARLLATGKNTAAEIAADLKRLVGSG